MTKKEKETTMLDDSFLRTFLGLDEPSVELPSGEGFESGFVGPVMAAMLWKFWSPEKIDLAEWIAEEGHRGFTSRGREGSWFYFFQGENHEEAKTAANSLGAYAPNRVWQFEIPTEEVINFGKGMSDPEATWGATIGGDCRITTPASAKYRHEFHMIALPAAVNALAQRMNYIPESMFSLNDLLDNQRFDDEFQYTMIGGKDHPYQDSKLWQQRAALWAALGEENTAAYNSIGTGDILRHDQREAEPNAHHCVQALDQVYLGPPGLGAGSASGCHLWSRGQAPDHPGVDYTLCEPGGSTGRRRKRAW